MSLDTDILQDTLSDNSNITDEEEEEDKIKNDSSNSETRRRSRSESRSNSEGRGDEEENIDRRRRSESLSRHNKDGKTSERSRSVTEYHHEENTAAENVPKTEGGGGRDESVGMIYNPSGMFYGYMPPAKGLLNLPASPGGMYLRKTRLPPAPFHHVYSRKPKMWWQGPWKRRFYQHPPWYWYGISGLGIVELLAAAHAHAILYPHSRNYNEDYWPYVYAQIPYRPPSALIVNLLQPPNPSTHLTEWAIWWTEFMNRAARMGMVLPVKNNIQIVQWIHPAYGYRDFFWIPPPYRQFIEMSWAQHK